MLNTNDIKYLQWVLKRLKYVYKEDPKILTEIETIITKGEKYSLFLDGFNDFISSKLQETEKGLQTIQKKIHSFQDDFEHLISSNKIKEHTETFEDINISELLK